MNLFHIYRCNRMEKRLSFVHKLCLVTFFGIMSITIIYNEHISYIMNSWTWNKLKCKDDSKCVKILLVADPQLIGEQNEIYHYITPLSILDSDRFLKKTYSLVVDHLSPDVIVFLGDIFDEGSIATPPQYNRYFERFSNIFTTEYPIVHIILPGDNDIGGETDGVTMAKIKRFEHSFVQESVINVENLQFSKINRMIQEKPKSFDMVKQYNNNDNKISIVLSHMPLVLHPAEIVDEVIEILKPKVIFSAHDHKSEIIQTDIWQDERQIDHIKRGNNKIHQYLLQKDKIIEISVPTCSYRMGTVNIGYGAAIIEEDKMQYTVLWSPKRFVYLKSYYGVIILLLICFIIFHFSRKIFRPRQTIMTKQQYSYKIIKNGV